MGDCQSGVERNKLPNPQQKWFINERTCKTMYAITIVFINKMKQKKYSFIQHSYAKIHE